MEGNRFGIPTFDEIDWPLTPMYINFTDWSQRLPQGVRQQLLNRHQAFVVQQDNILRNMNPTTGRNRMIARHRRICIDGQREDLNDYVDEVNHWANRDVRWRNLLQNRVDANNAAALQAEIDAFATNGMGPQVGGIRVGHINLNSLLTGDEDENGIERPDKFDNLRIIIGAWNFDVFVVGESRVKGVGSDSLQIAGYQMFRLDRDYPGESPTDGGLLVYVRDVLACRHVRSENRPLHNDFGTRVSLLQFIELELTFGFDVVSIVAVYNPPWGGHAAAMQLLLHEYRNHNPRIIFIGDINVDIHRNANADYCQQFRQLNFVHCIPNDRITRLAADTLVDHIYTKRNNVGMVGTVLEAGVAGLDGFADHCMIYCTLQGPGGYGFPGHGPAPYPMPKPMNDHLYAL